MSHTVEDGFAMIDAAQKGNRIVQVGSQRVSSIVYARAKEIYDSGKLGEVCHVEAHWDRNSPSGAWVYPIPPDASEQTIDWNAFLDGAPKRPFSPERFFRWRCFADYGEGLPGDLFVHAISGIHFVTGTNTVAKRAQSTGGLFRFKDGRDFPDLIETFYDYPTFRWPAQLRNEYLQKFQQEHPAPTALEAKVSEGTEVFGAPTGYSDLVDHEANFFNAVRSRKKVVENEEFGNNAAIGCHLANHSYFKESAAVWDAAGKKIKT